MAKKSSVLMKIVMFIMLLAIGLAFIAGNAGSVAEIVFLVAGIALIVSGVLSVLKDSVFNGIINIILGIVLLVCRFALANVISGFIPVVLGVFVIIEGLTRLRDKGTWSRIAAVVLIVAGAVMALSLVVSFGAVTDIVMKVVYIVVGVAFILNAVTVLISKR